MRDDDRSEAAGAFVPLCTRVGHTGCRPCWSDDARTRGGTSVQQSIPFDSRAWGQSRAHVMAQVRDLSGRLRHTAQPTPRHDPGSSSREKRDGRRARDSEERTIAARSSSTRLERRASRCRAAYASRRCGARTAFGELDRADPVAASRSAWQCGGRRCRRGSACEALAQHLVVRRLRVRQP